MGTEEELKLNITAVAASRKAKENPESSLDNKVTEPENQVMESAGVEEEQQDDTSSDDDGSEESSQDDQSSSEDDSSMMEDDDDEDYTTHDATKKDMTVAGAQKKVAPEKAQDASIQSVENKNSRQSTPHMKYKKPSYSSKRITREEAKISQTTAKASRRNSQQAQK